MTHEQAAELSVAKKLRRNGLRVLTYHLHSNVKIDTDSPAAVAST